MNEQNQSIVKRTNYKPKKVMAVGSCLQSISFLLLLSLLLLPGSIHTNPVVLSPWNTTATLERIKRFFNIQKLEPLHGSEQDTLPTTYLGEVNLDDYPECQDKLELPINKCQKFYHEHLYERILKRYWKNPRLTAHQAVKDFIYSNGGENGNVNDVVIEPRLEDLNIDRNSDYIKHASCCGMWKARDCVVEAIRRLEPELKFSAKICPDDLVERYRALPVEKKVKEDVLDYCSEFGDGAPICKMPWNGTISKGRSTHFFLVSAVFLLILAPFLRAMI